jgi:hypothetical protein
MVARFSFWTMTLCVLVAVVVSILAIWQFTGTDALWRTVATCGVIAAGTTPELLPPREIQSEHFQVSISLSVSEAQVRWGQERCGLRAFDTAT